MQNFTLKRIFINAPMALILLFSLCPVGVAESKANSSFQFHQFKGIEANNYGRYADAVDHLKRAMSLNPGIAETHFELAFAYDNLNQQDLAIKNYETGLKINPNFIPAYIMLAKAYVTEDGDLGKALRVAREAKRRDPESEEATQIIEAIEARIKTLPAGAELLENEKKYAEKGVGVYQSGDFVFVGPVRKGETSRK
jgi:tetratricopeptide (TPR) repeat protein